ncbi:hypothetical protein [Spirosoma endbachense]|uniref:Uncharacterized protein n=1 Tax=Spirosoma endbachense TaxID=2666025 RepID=A0A6P1W1L5_9BACT|nr:hypothetical protein [Spirosoma endbachense]QHV97870.1 hypothetical protein GJR95_23950 [Spirosoma endbachense]
METLLTFLRLHAYLVYGPLASLLCFTAIHLVRMAFRKPSQPPFKRNRL